MELIHGPGRADGILESLGDAAQLNEFNGPINEPETRSSISILTFASISALTFAAISATMSL